MSKDRNQYSEQEARGRFEPALRDAHLVGHKPQSEMKLGKEPKSGRRRMCVEIRGDDPRVISEFLLECIERGRAAVITVKKIGDFHQASIPEPREESPLLT
jgi:hypothetical protein